MVPLVVPFSGKVVGLNDFAGNSGGLPTINAFAMALGLPAAHGPAPIHAFTVLLCPVPTGGGGGAITASAFKRSLITQLFDPCGTMPLVSLMDCDPAVATRLAGVLQLLLTIEKTRR